MSAVMSNQQELRTLKKCDGQVILTSKEMDKEMV